MTDDSPTAFYYLFICSFIHFASNSAESKNTNAYVIKCGSVYIASIPSKNYAKHNTCIKKSISERLKSDCVPQIKRVVPQKQKLQ